MVIRLNPQFPVVWRTPDSIQIGIDRPITVVDHVSIALERVVNLLRVGLPRTSIVMKGREVGATDDELAALLQALRPALIATGEDRVDDADAGSPAPDARAVSARTFVCVDGAGPTARGIARSVAGLGIPVRTIPFDSMSSENHDDHSNAHHHRVSPQLGTLGSSMAVAVVIGHYALDPRRPGRWLRRDVPHLPVLFGDSAVHIGPFVEPGIGPCLYCVELHRVDLDPAWPAIAYQLSERLAPTETARISMEVTALVAGIVADRVETGRSELAAVSLTLDAATGRLTRRAHLPHAHCGCRALSEIATVPAGHAGHGPMPTNSAPASAWLA